MKEPLFLRQKKRHLFILVIQCAQLKYLSSNDHIVIQSLKLLNSLARYHFTMLYGCHHMSGRVFR
jgi:hypothetical protein